MTDQATLDALDDIENGAWLLIYRKREALAALGELAFDPARMPARNEEGCCWHPDLPGGVDLDASWQMSALGFDSQFVSMEHDADELYERYGEEGDLSMVAQWEPTSPGDGWKLAAIYDTEDGPCAMFVRCAALRARLAKVEPAKAEAVTMVDATCAAFKSRVHGVLAIPKGWARSDDGFAYGLYLDRRGILRFTATNKRHMEDGQIGFVPVAAPQPPSISEAALRDALTKQDSYHNMWLKSEIIAALRSLGIEVEP